LLKNAGFPHAKIEGQRIWVVSELYYPELTSTGYFLTGIAEGLAEFYDVSVLCGQPSYWARGVRAPSRETRNGVDIQRCWATTLNKNRLLCKVINLITISISILVAAYRRMRRGDAVIVVTNPPLLPYLVAFACRTKGVHLILLIHDVYPEILIQLGILKSHSFLLRLLDRASRWLYNSAYQILVLGRDMRDLISRKAYLRPFSIMIAANWADTEAISPQPRCSNGLLDNLNLKEKFVIQFWGNMGRPHCIEDLVDAAQMLTPHPEFHFLLICWGTKKDWVVAEKSARGLDNVTIIDPLPREESSNMQNACDLAVNTLCSGMTGISVPSRSYNAMAAKKPILAVCDFDSELAAMVTEEEIGWVVPPGRPDLIVSTLREAKANQNRLRTMGERARRAVEAKYTRRHALRVYQDIVEGLWSK
jgi:colanic acid biosynthesis glycosyl transferase WcaI